MSRVRLWIFRIDSLIGGLDQQAYKMTTTGVVCFRLRLSGAQSSHSCDQQDEAVTFASLGRGKPDRHPEHHYRTPHTRYRKCCLLQVRCYGVKIGVSRSHGAINGKVYSLRQHSFGTFTQLPFGDSNAEPVGSLHSSQIVMVSLQPVSSCL